MRIDEFIKGSIEQIRRVRTNLSYMYKFIVFVTPFLTVAYYFFLIYNILSPEEITKYTALTLAYFFPPAGKETVIPLMLSDKLGPPISPWIVGSTIVIIDIISSAIIAYNWWFAELIIKHIPYLDRGYEFLQKKAERFRKKKWLTISLLLFMITPFQGTGGISTTILSRLLGLKANKTVLIVALGSSITTGVWILWWLGFLNFLKGIFFILW
ncbi:MAG: small multi-drug export protein [Thermoplasmata archaeon]|nr:small multi-drug export protein [Thermoplasmata archaeon]